MIKKTLLAIMVFAVILAQFGSRATDVAESLDVELVADVERDGPDCGPSSMTCYVAGGQIAGYKEFWVTFTITLQPHAGAYGQWNCIEGAIGPRTQFFNFNGNMSRTLSVGELQTKLSAAAYSTWVENNIVDHCWYLVWAVPSPDNLFSAQPFNVDFQKFHANLGIDVVDPEDPFPEPSPVPTATPTPEPTPPIFQCDVVGPNWNGEGTCRNTAGTFVANATHMFGGRSPQAGETYKLVHIDHWVTGGSHTETQVTYAGNSKTFGYTDGSSFCEVMWSAGNGSSCSTGTSFGGSARVGFSFNTTPWHNGIEHIQFQFYRTIAGEWVNPDGTDPTPSATPTPTPNASPTPTPLPPGTYGPVPGAGFDVCDSQYTASQRSMCEEFPDPPDPPDVDVELCPPEADPPTLACSEGPGEPMDPFGDLPGVEYNPAEHVPQSPQVGSGAVECVSDPTTKVGYIAWNVEEDVTPSTNSAVAEMEEDGVFDGILDQVPILHQIEWGTSEFLGGVLGLGNDIVGNVGDATIGTLVLLWNSFVNLFVPGDCVQDILSEFVEETQNRVPFVWFGQGRAAIEGALSDLGGGGETTPSATISVYGRNINVGPAMTATAAMATPYRPWMVGLLRLGFAFWVFYEVLSFVGRRHETKQLDFGWD